jgi:CRISPR-associated protein Csx14
MAEADIPVDLFNPGQVFACLGFLEAAEILLGDAEGGFDWSDEANVRFHLRAAGEENPIAAVLTFLAEAEVIVLAPSGVEGPWPSGAEPTQEFPAPLKALRKSDGKGFTASVLPVALRRGTDCVPITHWLKKDSRDPLKLFAGQQVGAQLASNMLIGDPAKKGSEGYQHIHPALQEKNFADPFNEVCPVGGRFGFDARGGWDSMRIGVSLDKNGILVRISPQVEVLAAMGLENALPVMPSTYQISYAAWAMSLSICLARVALFAPESFLNDYEFRVFQAHLGDDKQYKKVFFAEEVTRQ